MRYDVKFLLSCDRNNHLQNAPQLNSQILTENLKDTYSSGIMEVALLTEFGSMEFFCFNPISFALNKESCSPR